MRKPAVVVAVAVSAVLAGGVMVATTAGAETAPDLPAIPAAGAMDDVPDLPELPADDRDPASFAADDRDPASFAADDRGPASFAADDPSPGDDPAGDGEPSAAATRTPRRPGGPAPSPSDEPAGAAPVERPRRPAAFQRPAQQPQRAAAQQAEPGAGSLTAAAHRDVTKSQALSSDPRGDVQRQALELVNQNRRDGGCGGVSADRRLIRAANEHAADMARRGYFAHESPNGDMAGERVEGAGYRWKRYGENIARGQDSVYEVVKGWMNSPEHRENIMDCKLQQVGLGLAFAPDRTPYWVQDFATPQ
ncbi:CAP domain-containing protein [Symbioplanes lichenis]|uniref:CAP domain-containing protein n=1 Tax=Symbioplanes lichenis TaxID=1629072 RepID=UPI0027381928|nr:CAP domain-containing protein [Actinoplanes lichenis]